MVRTNESPQPFAWEDLVPHFVHPAKVAVIEALAWIDQPLSPTELNQVLDEEFGVSLVSYHMRKLAQVGALERVRQQAVRGALQTFYALSGESSPRR
jgi:Helix-turn-helix domain